MILGGVNYLYTSFLSVYHMWISYLDVFICVLSAYDVYKKKTVLFTSPIILLFPNWIWMIKSSLLPKLPLKQLDCWVFYDICFDWCFGLNLEIHYPILHGMLWSDIVPNCHLAEIFLSTFNSVVTGQKYSP